MRGSRRNPARRERNGAARVLIVDDHPVLRRGLVAVLAEDPAIHVVGEAVDLPQAVAAAKRFAPDVVLIDFDLPGSVALAAVDLIAALGPATHVLALTDASPDDRLAAALRAGASGFVSKRADHGELLEAVRRAAIGESVLPPELVRRLLRSLAHPHEDEGLAEPLSDRELDVLRALALGLTNGEIGGRLGISAATVRTHVGHILGKLGLHRRIQAVLYAFRHGIARVDGDARPDRN